MSSLFPKRKRPPSPGRPVSPRPPPQASSSSQAPSTSGTSKPKRDWGSVLRSLKGLLNLAKAGVTGLGVPAVEPVVNGVLGLWDMLEVRR